LGNKPSSECCVAQHQFSAGNESAFGVAKGNDKVFQVVCFDVSLGIGVEFLPSFQKLINVILVDW